MFQAHSYDKIIARKFDNADLWCLFCDVSLGHEGEVRLFKVKAHVAKARERFLTQLSMFKADIARAACIQTHLVRTMVTRAQTSLLAPFDGFEPSDGATPAAARCPSVAPGTSERRCAAQHRA